MWLNFFSDAIPEVSNIYAKVADLFNSTQYLYKSNISNQLILM